MATVKAQRRQGASAATPARWRPRWRRFVAAGFLVVFKVVWIVDFVTARHCKLQVACDFFLLLQWACVWKLLGPLGVCCEYARRASRLRVVCCRPRQPFIDHEVLHIAEGWVTHRWPWAGSQRLGRYAHHRDHHSGIQLGELRVAGP